MHTEIYANKANALGCQKAALLRSSAYCRRGFASLGRNRGLRYCPVMEIGLLAMSSGGPSATMWPPRPRLITHSPI